MDIQIICWLFSTDYSRSRDPLFSWQIKPSWQSFIKMLIN